MWEMGPPAIAVEGGHVFVAAGGILTVFKFDGSNLQKVAEAPYARAPERAQPQEVFETLPAGPGPGGAITLPGVGGDD